MTDYGMMFTARKALESLTAEKVVAGFVGAGFTEADAEKIVAAAEQSFTPKMAYVYNDAGDLEEAILTDEWGFEELLAAAPEGWTVSADEGPDVADDVYDRFKDEKEGL